MSFNESVDDLVAFNETGLLGAHPSWDRVRLQDVCSILNGFPFPSTQFRSSGGTPLIRIRDVMRGWSETSFHGSFDPAYIVRHGELVVGMDGDFNCALWAGSEALLNQRVCKLTPAEGFYDLRLLAYALPGYLGAINAKTSAITVKHLSSKTVAEIPLPLPPRSEQSRLVEAIDSYLTRLDDARTTLEQVQRNLKRYRTSVLNAAVEGRLVPTEAELARAEGREYEPASVLLQRILAERRRRWEEAELAKMKAKGKVAKNDKWKAKYVEPARPDTSVLPELPEGWCWACPEQIASPEQYAIGIGPFGSNLKVTDYRDEGIPLIFVRNIRAESFEGNGANYVTAEKAMELKPHIAKAGDILITKMGEPPGDAAIYPFGRPDGVITADCIRLRSHPIQMCTPYLLSSIRSPVFQEQIIAITKGVAQKKVSLERFKLLAIPIPPLSEQYRVACEVDRLLSVKDAVMTAVVREAQRVMRLRQSILKWAFEGRLVDQDPNDEPAAVLLERIRAERTAANGKK